MTRSKFNPPTLADEGQTERVRCSCGRLVWPSHMARVDAMPDEVRGIALHPDRRAAAAAAGELPTHLCDGCRERAVHSGLITREEVARRLGAPKEVIARAQQRDVLWR